MNLDKYAPESAKRIAVALVDAALAAGYSLGVYDGEETTVRHSRDRQEVLEALASTDHDHLRFYRPDASKAGYVLLIWENGDDAASDWSDNAETNALVLPVLFGLGVL